MSTIEMFRVLTDELTPGVRAVSLVGEGDLYSAPELESALADALADDPVVVVVDLAAATFIDSTILGVLLKTAKRARSSGSDLVLVCNDRRLQKVFDIAGVRPLFRFERSVADALIPRAKVA